MPTHTTNPAPQIEPVATPAFVLAGKSSGMVCDSIRAPVPAGTIESLGQRVSDFLAQRTDGPDILAGAVPFSRDAHDFLFQPVEVRHLPGGALPVIDSPIPVSPGWRLIAGGAPSGYRAAVAAAVDRIRQSQGEARVDKIVLARHVELELKRRPIIYNVLRKLSQDTDITVFCVPVPDAFQERMKTGRHLVGATPELLLSKQGNSIRSHPLAGTALRSHSARDDRAAAQALINSDKDQREHAAVTEFILDTLAPWCNELSSGHGPVLTSTRSLWHLGTEISGTLKDESTPCVELLSELHPTPAVCGNPRDTARAAIRELEPFARDFYAGAVGWTNSAGDGAWHVSIRCADIADRRVRLYAGAGIVEGSDPDAEVLETEGKFAAMLDALGIDGAALHAALADAS